MGDIQFLDPKFLKPSLLKKITSIYKEDQYKSNNFNDNEEWFNDILRVEPFFDIEQNKIVLKYREDHKYITGNLLMRNTLKMKSAYSENLKKLINFLEKGEEKIPFCDIEDYDQFISMELNAIKLGKKNIEKTVDFVKKFTLDLPVSVYNKGLLQCVDYIFYQGNLEIMRTLNIPDINKIALDFGYMPNKYFPSDHLILAADFLLI